MVLVVLVALDAAIAVNGRVDLELERVSAGYQLLLPPIVALLIPWSTKVHLSWLGVHVALVAIGSTLAIPGSMLPDGPRALVGLLAIASALSLFGHLAGLHARVDTFTQIEEMRSINRRARRADAALRAVNHDLELVARTDRLTGLGNRLALHEQLRLVRSRIGRYDERYALLLLDLDRFKGINDTLGHFVGDEILSRVAHQIALTTRDSDTAFRFGGEEFIVLLPLGLEEAMLGVADRVRLAIERLAIAHPANPPHHVVTVSVGVTAIDQTRLDESDETWLHDADVALYRAKRHGRNRTEQATGRRGSPVVTSLESGRETPRSATPAKA